MTWHRTFRTKLAVAFLLLAVSAVAVSLYLAWGKSRAAQLEALQSLLVTTTGAIAPEIDGDLHASLEWTPALAGDPRFEALRAITRRVKASNPRFREAYTLAVDDLEAARGRVAVADKDRQIGEAYDLSKFPGMLRALRGTASADDDLIADAEGPSLSGYAPIRDNAGRVVALFGIDIEGSTVDAMRSELLWLLVGGSIAAVVLSAVLGWFFATRLGRPVAELTRATERVGAGDFATRLEGSPGVEFGRLYDGFNRMTAGLEERQRLKQALLLAMEVQQRLLPSAPPDLATVELAGVSRYCDETGGDYFDYPPTWTLPGGRVALTIGDVTGHGIGAALMMASARAVLRTHAESAKSPGEILAFVNSQVARDTTAGKFMTLFYAVLDPDDGSLLYANAGQGGCYVLRRKTGRFEELCGLGPPIGVLPGLSYEERRIEGLLPGDVVALCTDGVWETQDVAGAFFGIDAFTELVRRGADRPLEALPAAVFDALLLFRGTAPQTDDVTLLFARLRDRYVDARESVTPGDEVRTSS